MANEQEILQDTRDAPIPPTAPSATYSRVWATSGHSLCCILYSTGGRWRFKQLQRLLPDISQKSLTQTLRMLEEDGFVSRKVYAEVPPRVEYSLTERSMSFLPVVNSLIDWAKENMADIISDRARHREGKETAMS